MFFRNNHAFVFCSFSYLICIKVTQKNADPTFIQRGAKIQRLTSSTISHEVQGSSFGLCEAFQVLLSEGLTQLSSKLPHSAGAVKRVDVPRAEDGGVG